MIDTHAHLDVEEFAGDRPEVIARAEAAGVTAIVCPAISAASSQAVVQLAGRHGQLYAAVGIQPNYAAAAEPGDWDRVVALAGQPRVVAIGETGLIATGRMLPIEVQQDYFDRNLRLAQSRDLPVIIHCRRRKPISCRCSVRRSRGLLRGVLHSFSGDAAMARECLDWAWT